MLAEATASLYNEEEDMLAKRRINFSIIGSNVVLFQDIQEPPIPFAKSPQWR
jgi:hypothetical protein